jgi:hypothetical protein
MNMEFDMKYAVVPLDLAAEPTPLRQRRYANGDELNSAKDMDRTAKELRNALGEAFLVKTRYQKNALMYQHQRFGEVLHLRGALLHRTHRCVQHHRLAHHDDDREAPDMRTLMSMGATPSTVRGIFLR